jgi:hypothetical protein
MNYRYDRGRWDDAGERIDPRRTGGRLAAGARDGLESDGYYNGATYPHDRAAPGPWPNDGEAGGRHRRDGRQPIDGGRGGRRYDAAGPGANGSSTSGRFVPTEKLRARPDGRQSRQAPATPQVARAADSRANDRVGRESHSTPRLAGVAWLAAGAGVATDGLAVTLAWHNSSLGVPLFWLAIVAPFLVFATILVRCWPSQATRQLTVVLLGIYPAVIYRMTSPLVLGAYDEHLHERTLNDLLSGSGLFAPNPLLSVSPQYPGLELFTGVLIRLTGLPVIAGMELVVFMCRILLALAIYHGALDLTRSYRRASLMVIFYAASAEFYYYDSLFAYETIALALAVGGLVILNRALQRDFPAARRKPLLVLATVALMASVVSHHATSWITVAFLIGWTATAKRENRRALAYITGMLAAAAIFWTALSVNELAPYMGPILLGIIDQLKSSFLQIHPFKDTAGDVQPLWERLTLIIYAVLATVAAVTSGFLVLRRAWRERQYTLAFVALLSIAFPATLASHFVPSATYAGDRASTFLALPAALCCALAVRNPISALRQRGTRARIYFVSLVGVTTLAFLGAVVMSTGPTWQLLPGKYLVEADSHAQDPETLAAVRWAAAHLPAGSNIIADRVPADLLAAEARMWTLKGPEDGIYWAAIYFSSTWQPSFDTMLKRLDIQYIYVDDRLSESLSHEGFYIYDYETPAPTRITVADLAKFKDVPGLTVAYHHGPVTIYDTAGLGVRMTTRTGYTATRPLGFSPPLEVLAGALLGLLLVLPRRRWSRLMYALRGAGPVGFGMAIIPLAILAGAVLFETRWMPGPEFTIGAIEMAAAVVVARRWAAGRRVVPRGIFRAVHPLALLGVLAIIAGVLLSIHSAWQVDVTTVDHILRSVADSRR